MFILWPTARYELAQLGRYFLVQRDVPLIVSDLEDDLLVTSIRSHQRLVGHKGHPRVGLLVRETMVLQRSVVFEELLTQRTLVDGLHDRGHSDLGGSGGGGLLDLVLVRLGVVAQLVGVEELPLALVAREALLLAVRLGHVVLEVTLVPEALAAELAGEGRVPGVDPAMVLQPRAVHEGLAAVCARVLAVGVVVRLEVPFEVVPVGEDLAAGLAGLGLEGALEGALVQLAALVARLVVVEELGVLELALAVAAT